MTREEASRILNYLKDKACSKAERVAISMALSAFTPTHAGAAGAGVAGV